MERPRLRQDEVIDILRGKGTRKARGGSMVASIHVLDRDKCTVQIGSRVIAEDVSLAEAQRLTLEKQIALAEKGIVLKVETWERK